MRSAITCKTCRRLGMSVCGREKCAFKRKPYPPGEHGKSFKRGLSEFGSQLKEKQKLKYLYGLRERQFKNYVLAAIKQKTVAAGRALLLSLEARLDNTVFRLGLASTRASARQMVNHGHIAVNGKRVTIPSCRVKIGDTVSIYGSSASKKLFLDLAIKLKKYSPPQGLDLDKESFLGKATSPPSVEELSKNYNISAIVEYYSR